MSRTAAALTRLGGAFLGGIIAFAAWLVLLLSTMPRPPVPPSYPATLTAALVAAAGFSIGMHSAERITGCRRSRFIRMYCGCLAGTAAGATLMYPFGGMMAGFGLMALGAASMFVWEIRH